MDSIGGREETVGQQWLVRRALLRAEMELGCARGREEWNVAHDIIKRGENAKGADRWVWGFHNKVSSEVLITPLIMRVVKKQQGHQVAPLSENVPAVSNVQ